MQPYVKHEWYDGEVIVEELLNHIEEGIASVTENFNNYDVNKVFETAEAMNAAHQAGLIPVGAVCYVVEEENGGIFKNVEGNLVPFANQGSGGGGSVSSDYTFDTVAEMNAAINAGIVEDGATCYVREELIHADSTNY
jgi:hypothetical protein